MTTELERREAKGGKGCLFVLFLALLLPSMGTCGGIGAKKAMAARSGVLSVDLASVSDEKRVPDGTYVRADARGRPLRLIARDELPIGDRLVVRARGTSVYTFGDQQSIVVACSGTACLALEREPPAAPAHVVLQGRVCPTESQIMCPLDEGLKAYLRHEDKGGRAHRVLVVGEKPSDNVWEAAVPRRVEIVFREQAYRALEVTVTVTDIITNARGMSPALAQMVHQSFEHSFQQVAAVLR